MTEDEMRQATGLGPAWHVIWAGADPSAEREHLCGAAVGSMGAYRREWVLVRYVPTGMPGVQAAKCERCRIAWVRAVAA